MSKFEHEPVGFSEIRGVRYLHLGSEWIQGAMNLKHPNKIELEYAQQMMGWLLFLEPKKNFKTLQLGLGTGSISKFCHNLNSEIQVTAVDINPAVIVASRIMFDLPFDSKRLNVIQDNALTFVNSKKNHKVYDVIQVDLYDGSGDGPALSSKEFYEGCFNSLNNIGVLTVNLFGRHESFNTNIENLCDAFGDRVLVFPEVHDYNVVVMAFKGPKIEIPWRLVQERAQYVQKHWGLPTKKWVKGLKHANFGQEKSYLKI
jgi:spermidine synthase